MASRLIQRSCRLLAASASFQPLPASTLSECVRSCQVAPSFLPKASLHISSLCSLAESLPEPFPEPSGETNEQFIFQLLSAASIDDLLQIGTSQQLDGDKSCSVIRKLANTQLRNKQEILEDQRFHDLLTAANKQIQRIHHNQLVMLLRSLHTLGVNRKDQNLQSVETEVLWRLRRLSIGNLAQLSSFLFPQDCTMAKGPLQVELVKQVELRWTEIEDAKTVAVLLFSVGPMSQKLMEHLEDKVLELAAQFTPGQTKKIILALTAQGRQSLPVLRVLSFHLVQQQQELSTTVMLSLLSSFAKLNFCHTQLLEKMAKDLIPKLPQLTTQKISWLIRWLSLLKFSSVPLFEAITQNCLERSESFSSFQLDDIILNFANLNFHPSEEFFSMVLDSALQFADQFTPEQITKVITAFASQGWRSLPVLRVLSFHLWQHHTDLSPSVILDFLSSCAKLNFCHTQLLEKMTKDIIPKLPELSPHEISWLTRCLSLLKFSSVPLFEAITQNCLERSESFKSIQLCSVILNFANLNFHPSEELFSLVHQRVSSEMDSLPFNLQLELVFSLCILSQVTTPVLQRVLEPQFYGKILEDASPKSGKHCWKLLQINCTAQLECPDYEGPLLPRDVLQSLVSKAEFPNSYNLQKSIQDALKIIYPAPEACRFNAPTVYGWQPACEVVLDSELHVLPLNDLEAPHCPQFEGTQPLPKGARRLVVVGRDFQDFIFCSKDLLGRYMMNRRHLQMAGFLVVEVPYYRWQELNSEWLQQSYLKDQIKKAVAEDMAR